MSQEQLVSIYPQESVFPVYSQQAWWSDKWDGIDYGREFNFSRSFSEQFHDLFKAVPRISILNMYSENSEYTNFCWRNKNCYLLISSGDNRDSMYSRGIWNCKDCVDCDFSSACELCYQCIYATSCYHSSHLYDCQNCVDCFACKDCQNCQDCLFSQGLRNKRYYIHNNPYSQEEFEKRKQQYLDTISPKSYTEDIAEQLRDFSVPHVFCKQINCQNCTGDELYNCKHCDDCYYCRNLEDCRFMHMAYDGKDSHDAEFSDTKVELFYNGLSLAGYNLLFCAFVWDSDNVSYSDHCFNSSDLFGCIGLRHKQYCILNKQYTKVEYEELVSKIIEHMQKTGEWGEFFPVEISPFAYNETVAQEYFPLEKTEILKNNWKWKKPETPHFSQGTKKIQAGKLPESITDIPDDILNWAIECAESKRLFKIQKAELEFYRKMNLPIPRLHPDVRHAKRMSMRNPRKLWNRNCDKCQKQIQTTYAPDRAETVYCEACYLENVY